MKRKCFRFSFLFIIVVCSLVHFINSKYSSENYEKFNPLIKGGIFQVIREEKESSEIKNSEGKYIFNEYKNKISICDIGFAILSAPKYFDSRVRHLENSWLKHLCRNIKSENKEHLSNYVLVSSTNHPSIPTMTPNCNEDYQDLCCKTLASFKWMLKSWPEKKWYMKLDDDTFVILPNLLDELSSIDYNGYYLVGGQIYLTLEDSIVESTSSRSNILNWKYHGEVIKGIRGGAGYLMSKPLTELFVKNSQRYLDICNNGGSRFKTFEDASLSLLITELVGQKSILQIPGFHFHNPFISYRSEYENRGFKPISFHLMHDTSMMRFFDYLLNGGIRPPTYSCSHMSTNVCISRFDLTVSSKYWDPVFFGPLNSTNSYVAGENAVLKNESFFEKESFYNHFNAYFQENTLENNKNYHGNRTDYIPKHKNILEMSYPGFKYNNTQTPILDIMNITKQMETLGLHGQIIPTTQMENNSPSKDHPCKNMIATYSNELKNYYSNVLFDTKEVLFIGFPDHPNRGDSAIFTGALILLETINVKIIKAIHLAKDYNYDETLTLFTVPLKQRAIIFHGGGNFGDLYSHHHQLRYTVLNDFSDYKVVMFPQTVFFKDKNKQLITKNNFERHKGELYLAARDTSSFFILKEMFNSTKIEIKLLPDLAFLIGDQRKRRGIPSLDILIHARMDNEAPQISLNGKMVKMNKVTKNEIKKFLVDSNSNGILSLDQENILKKKWIDYLTITVDDWLESDANYNNTTGNSFIEKSVSRTIDGMAFLSRANFVITNRLHGHILLTLLGIKHIVMGDSFGKMEHFRNTWTSSCPLSLWYEDFSDALIRASIELSI